MKTRIQYINGTAIAFLYRNIDSFLIIIATLLSLISFIYYFHLGVTTSYNDAKAHLNIARRVSDNLTPGFAQLGGVWLPLLHVLMLPTIWNSFMWHSGISGSIVNMFSYVLAVIYIYKLIYIITKSKLNGLIAALCMGLNINLLYLQSTPMTEALFVATLTMSVYYLTKWTYIEDLQTLLVASIFFFLSSINRYEGWIVAIAATICVIIISCFRYKFNKTEGLTILFGTLALAGMVLWLVWQLAIFHDPFYFLNSQFSAKYQTSFQISSGGDPAFKSIIISAKTFYYTVCDVLGYVAVGAASIGLIAYLISIFDKKKHALHKIPLLILLIPGIFLVYAMYKGNIPVIVPQISINGKASYFNIRYALYTLPAVSAFIAILSKKKIINFTMVLIVLLNAYLLFNKNGVNIATLTDAGGISVNIYNKNFYEWGKYDYHHGLILASATTSDPILFNSGLNMKNFITEGNGKYGSKH